MQIGEIQKGLVLPPKPENVAFGATPKYPFDDMVPGDSLPITPTITLPQTVTLPGGLVQQVPGDTEADIKKKVKALYVNVCSAVKRYARKAENAAKRFEVRKFSDGVRVWRVEDVPVVVETPPAPPVAPTPATAVPPPPAPPTESAKGGKKK